MNTKLNSTITSPSDARSNWFRTKRIRALVLCSVLFALTDNRSAAAIKDIGPLDQVDSAGTALNASGEVAGTYHTPVGTRRAFIYSAGITRSLGVLGLPAGWDDEFGPVAINVRGEVAGNMHGRGFLYRNSEFTVLGDFGTYSTYVADLNDFGQVAGSSGFFPFLYESGLMIRLGDFYNGDATALNNRGDVVGRNFFYLSGIMTHLGGLWGGSAIAVDVNESGEVAGWFQNEEGNSRGFFYDGSMLRDIGTLGGPQSRAVGINNAGEVVGWSDIAGGGRHGFLYRDGVMVDLCSPEPMSPLFSVLAINDAGQVLGQSYNPVPREGEPEPNRAFLYSNGRWNDLGTLGGAFTEAGWSVSQIGLSSSHVLNNSGQVTGSSQTADGKYHAFLWTPDRFALDGIVWHQPLARNGASEDTDPSAGGTLKYRFKLGSTVPVKVHALGFTGKDITNDPNVTGKVEVFEAIGCDSVSAGNTLPIEYNGVGGVGGAMQKVSGHLVYNLDSKLLPSSSQCFLLKVTVTDTGTGESHSEMVPLQSK
jgi:probable HAF family extracellular repeat protein